MERPILITASSMDAHAYEPVKTILEDRNYPVVIYKTDKVLSEQEQLHIEISDQGNMSVEYEGIAIAPQDIGAAWYRKIAGFDLAGREDDKAKQLHIHSEIRELHEAVWSAYPENIWLNSPKKMREANAKLTQLMLASDIGFTIPTTLIGNDWDRISDKLLDTPDSQMAVKVIRGIISDQDIIKAMYTTVLNRAKVSTLKNTVNPFPGLYQPFISKLREWRITIVGDDVFPAAIYTNQDAKDDWRVLQTTSAVSFRHEKPPGDLSKMCIEFLGRTGLKFGTFDCIETPSEELFFLECNPNGQYGWLEDELGFPISERIATHLVAIAREYA